MGTSKSNKNNTMNYKVGVWLRKKTLKMEEVQKVADKVNKWISSHKAIELTKIDNEIARLEEKKAQLLNNE